MIDDEVLSYEEIKQLPDDQRIGKRIKYDIDLTNSNIEDEDLKKSWLLYGVIVKKESRENFPPYDIVGTDHFLVRTQSSLDKDQIDNYINMLLKIDHSFYLVVVKEWQPVIEFGYDRIKQNGLTGELIKLSTKHKRPDIDGSVSIYTEKIVGTINGFDNLLKHTLGMNAETWRLFDFLMKLAYERGFTGANPTVAFTVDEYMELRGYKDTKPNREQARKRLNAELDVLYSADVIYNSRYSGYSGRLVVNKEISKRSGLVSVSLHNGLKPLIEQMKWFFYPRQLWILNLRYNPNAYYFGRRVSLHKSMNYHKKNANIISVNALIESSPELQKYEDLQSGSGLRRNIIDPFERDMDIITAFKWQYISRNGDIVDRSDVTKYEQFISLNVKIDWKNYPEIEQKQEPAKKKKKK